MDRAGTLQALLHILDGWMLRYRLRRALVWGLRGLALCLALALAAGAALLFAARLLPLEYALLLLLPALGGLLGGAALGLAWPFPRERAARFFDRQFGLQERVSTALELAGSVLDELGERQLQDALASARAVGPRARLPLRLRPLELVPLLALLLLAPLIPLLGRPAIQAAQQARQVQAAVEREAERLDELISEIEANQRLDEEQRAALLEPLQEARQELEQSASLESALSALSKAEGELQRLQDQNALEQARALQEAGERLGQAPGAEEGNPLQAFQEALNRGDFEAAAQALQELELEPGTREEAEADAQLLEQAAGALEGAQPALAAQLRQAARALREGDPQAAGQALNAAGRQVAETGQAAEAARAASQAAGQLRQGQQSVAASGGQNQPGQQGGSQGGSGQQGQANQGTSGSGTGEGGPETAQGPEAPAVPIQSGNQPGDGGEREADPPVYAPERLGAGEGQEVVLPGNEEGGGQQIGQGGVLPGENTSSQVPYSEVYADYAAEYYRAIESGQVPPALRDLVRQYFSSLEP